MKLFLAGFNGRYYLIDESVPSRAERDAPNNRGGEMQLYLAGVGQFYGEKLYDWMRGGQHEPLPCGRNAVERGGQYDRAIQEYKPFVLESFYYVDEDTERLMPRYGDFLLDSGAFTFMQNTKTKLNWDEYIERYAEFINRNNVEKYFELDIDSVVGYTKVKEFRAKLERLTNRPCIPVWHKSRGYKEFQRMCDEYGYAAIGGIVSGEIKSTQYGLFPAMIADAHARGCKLHGLGFTSLDWLPKCHFDSVDSTAWTTGNRFGHIYKFDGRTMKKISAPNGKRLGDARKVALINYTEWLKFQQYALSHFKKVRQPHEKNQHKHPTDISHRPVHLGIAS